MAALFETLSTTNVFSNIPCGLPPTLEDPTHPWPYTLSRSPVEKVSLIQSLRKQKANTEKVLYATQEWKPQSQPARKTRRVSKPPYSSCEDVGLQRARYLERNRIAANKFRIKKKKEHQHIQSSLECETKKHDTLLAQVNGLREELWHLKNQVFEHATECDDQSVNLQLALMTQNMVGTNTNVMKCPYSKISVNTWSDMSMENGNSGGINSGALEDITSAAHGEHPDSFFDSFIYVPNM
ncbi:hypothetical protein N7490_006656 [Penicillium lividum]|nr:hypothetical protein N7490_006236 [Penicillium lividum]KAJ5642656.1 hypothetical protein N7490_006656 [Penicillium lividum]